MRLRAFVAELIGTAFLLAAVVGSGIMGDQLAGGNVAIALLANTLATGAALITLILTFGFVSGAHFNPAVSIADASQGGLSWADAGVYTIAQVVGAFLGVGLAHVMFGKALYSWSTHARAGIPQIVSEAVATFGLLSVIWGCGRRKPNAVRSPSARTSPPPIGSRRPRRSRILPSRWQGQRLTLSPESVHSMSPAFWSDRQSAPPPPRCSSGGWFPRSPKSRIGSSSRMNPLGSNALEGGRDAARDFQRRTR